VGRRTPGFSGADSGCSFDYSTSEARESLLAALDSILELREDLKEPAAARRVGQYERLFERSLGLAVAPVLLFRALRRERPAIGAALRDEYPDLAAEIRRELVCGGLSRKMALYERSLGFAVIPVMLRRVGYRMRLRAQRPGAR